MEISPAMLHEKVVTFSFQIDKPAIFTYVHEVIVQVLSEYDDEDKESILLFHPTPNVFLRDLKNATGVEYSELAILKVVSYTDRQFDILDYLGDNEFVTVMLLGYDRCPRMDYERIRKDILEFEGTVSLEMIGKPVYFSKLAYRVLTDNPTSGIDLWVRMYMDEATLLGNVATNINTVRNLFDNMVKYWLDYESEPFTWRDAGCVWRYKDYLI